MRREDRVVDDFDQLDEERKHREDLEHADAGERYEDEEQHASSEIRETVADERLTHRGMVLGVMESILAGDHVVVSGLPMAERELRALEAFQASVTARDSKLGQFVYADDRRDLLEQSLGILQPTLSWAGAPVLGADFTDIMQGVASLREQLVNRADAQDELLVGEAELAKAEDKDDDDADKDDDGDVAVDGVVDGADKADKADKPAEPVKADQPGKRAKAKAAKAEPGRAAEPAKPAVSAEPAEPTEPDDE